MKPVRIKWTSEQDDNILASFYDFIVGEGPYPLKSDIQNFFDSYPNILEGFSDNDKHQKFRVKLNDIRKISRGKKNLQIKKMLKF